MGGTPHVSVVIPAYEAAELLPATLRSILAQTYRDFEVIVVVDGSPDDTGAVADRFAEADSRVRPVHLDRNVGRSAARNRGLDEARGTWICPMDADDLWFRGRLRELVAASEAYPAVEAFTDDLIEFTVGDDGTVTLGQRHVSRVSWWMGGTHPLRRGPWFRDRECHMRAMIRRDLIQRRHIRFPEGLSAGEDLAFYLQVAFAPDTPAPVRVAQANYYYRVGHSMRAANMAESRVRLTELAVEATGSAELARLVAETNPARVFMSHRGDRIWAEQGRSGERDAGSDDVELVMDRWAGYRQLLLNRGFEAVGKLADRHLRPAIAADIAEQLGLSG
jgi:glycosyltransferase involved in cell wall biosynthesis